MTNAEAKAIIEANAVPVFPLQIDYQDWLEAITMAAEALTTQDKIDYFIDYVKTNWLQYKYIEVADMLSILERLKVKEN